VNPLSRSQILPETVLPDAAEMLAQGRSLAPDVTVASCPFLTTYDVQSEIEYKQARVGEQAIMLHAQVGYRDLEKSKRAYAEICERVAAAGHRVDRYGICLDWSMGYPTKARRNMPRGTGLILQNCDEFAQLTAMAPVAPHFGDFVMGMPAAVENTVAALRAGATCIGNLGQYFTFRLPHWHDDVETTAETLKALALVAAQPVPVLIHSNLDDGFAALFRDLSCALGAVLLEQYIVEELVGGRIGHCYGHTYSDPITRLAFQRALVRVSNAPGTMVYGNTTIFGAELAQNYASLSSYLLVDILAQKANPSGHALNPVPVTEAIRIPEIDEIIDAHLFANRLVEMTDKIKSLFDIEKVDETVEQLVSGGQLFKQRVLSGLAEAGIDISDAFELLLSIRRIGARSLEQRFGPGQLDKTDPVRRVPVVPVSTISELEQRAISYIEHLSESDRANIRSARLTGCIATTDVHEYGKLLIEAVLQRLGVSLVDGGVSTDPEVLIGRAIKGPVDFIGLSTYNGVALDYLQRTQVEMEKANLGVPIFIGGRLNQIPESTNTSLPVDVSQDLNRAGAIVCLRIEDMFERLVAMAKQRQRAR